MKKLLIVCVILSLGFKNKDASITTSEVMVTTEHPQLDFNKTSATSQFIRTTLYRGTLNETVNISLYLNEQEHPCGGNLTILSAMYKYDDQDKWLLLSVTTDALKKKYCLVEDYFTGVLFLEENGSHFNGTWISPNAKKQFKIELETVPADKFFIEKLDEILFDDLLYHKNDC